MSRILIVDQERRPLMPTTPARARMLLKSRRAAILRRFPLILILKEARPEAVVEPLRIKLDPGSQTSGIAVVNDRTGEVVWAAELTHRSQQIHEALTTRRAVRRSRRQRHTRYRAARFANRRRPAGWLAPSLMSRVLHLRTWVKRLSRWCPLGTISQELVRFDTAAVGASTPERVRIRHVRPWMIEATGHQARRMVNVDELGFPRGRAKGPSCVQGFKTGDLVRASVTKGKKVGTYVGRVAIKTDGYFKMTGSPFGMVEGIHARYCTSIHRKDGYSYSQAGAALPPQA